MSKGEFLSTYVIVYDWYLLLFSIFASTLSAASLEESFLSERSAL